ncbi:fused response regulator/phosphatase [Streptomyces sp. NPDC006733]|uniref:fused response regulator/phosphatase n=1 Tax=Streptomyces sp. NPDC006733 TaxID=3155460 RepID=UPI0033E4E040
MNDDIATDSAPAVVLVVDDNATNRYIIASWLSRSGHTVIEAADGTETLAILASGADPAPEIVVLDVRLPDMSGYEVCEAIKATPHTAGMPVIHVSASAVTSADRIQGLHRGADAYLTEPIDPDELLATVTAALRYARARRRAEALAARLTALNRTTLEVYRAIGFHSFAQAATTGATTLMGCRAAAVFLSPQGQAVHTTATAGRRPVSRPVRADLLVRLTQHTLGSDTGADLTTIPQALWNSLLPHDPVDEDVTVVLARTKRGRPPVCLAVPAGAVTTSDDHDLFLQLAQACALSLEALRTYNEEHSLALTLQRTFLPERLPEVPGTTLAVRYIPATDQAEIGGDFYEATETDAGLLLAIGDVVGHSLAAAAVMGELRHALRAYAVEGHDPATILQRLDTLLIRLRPGITMTVCMVLIEHGNRRIHVSNGGHIPPLLLYPDGTAAFVPQHSALLGLGLPHPTAVTRDVPPGTRLLLVTDGLVEERGKDLDLTLEQFRRAASSGSRNLEALCDDLLQRFGTAKDDDIAVLAAQLD